ncbi:hypothetical protein B6U90_06240 [Thermoplasmatales archaeon ex4484_6]|nr:MAG: hypothetical protein B6U90_06240 [Thermoplasmatales archaeon ex4484_6]RLF65826.1 MAG: hypothetical protein DRN57_08285 [Thermoplasmata archaeon]
MKPTMKRAASFFLVGALLLGVLLISGCTDRISDGDKEYTDPTGHVVKLKGDPERVVTLTPSLTETVVALGAGGLLVGADSVSASENPDLDLETVSTWEGLDTEKIVSLSPDIVIMDRTLDITDASFNALDGLSIPVYRIFPKTFDEVLSAITGVGEVLGREKEAGFIVDDMGTRRDTITEETSRIEWSNRSSVLYVTYYDGTSDPWVGTSSTFSGSLIELAGGKDAVSDDSGVVVQISVETVIDADPDVIICSQSESWPTHTRETILSDPLWEDITAVREGRVFDVNGDLIDRTGPRLIEGLETIHLILFPEEV